MALSAVAGCSSPSVHHTNQAVCRSGSDCVSLSLSGAETGSLTTDASPPGHFEPICTTLPTPPAQWVSHVFGTSKGQPWLIVVQVAGYNGPGRYDANVTLGNLTQTGAAGGKTYYGTAHTSIGANEDSATISGTLQPQKTGGHGVTVNGTLSCAGLRPQR